MRSRGHRCSTEMGQAHVHHLHLGTTKTEDVRHFESQYQVAHRDQVRTMQNATRHATNSRVCARLNDTPRPSAFSIDGLPRSSAENRQPAGGISGRREIFQMWPRITSGMFCTYEENKPVRRGLDNNCQLNS